MNQIYTDRKKADPHVSDRETGEQPSFDALRIGAAAPSREQKGHRVDLPDAIREKMETAFGADLSSVKLYESETVRDAGAEAVAQGSDIAFAPGMLDFTSYGGQARLGHELSHVVSQARGEVRGSGFLNDHTLEARADREGAMAASGQQIAIPTSALSPATAAPASGPMQASKKEKQGARAAEEDEGVELEDLGVVSESEPASETAAEPEAEKKKPKSNGAFEKIIGGLVSQNEMVAKVTDPLSDLKGTKQSIAEKLASARKAEQTVGKIFGKESMKNGALTSRVGSKADSTMATIKKMGLDKFAKNVGNVSKIVSTTAAVPQALMKFSGAYDKLDKANEYGTDQDAEDAKLDLINSGLGAMKKSSSLVSTIAKQFNSKAAKRVGNAAKSMGSALTLGSQGVGLIKDIRHVRESDMRKQSLAASVKAMQERAGGEMSEDDKEKLAIFRQGKRGASLDKKQSMFDTASDTLGLASNVMNITGMAPASAALEGAQSAVDIAGDEVMGYEKNKAIKKTVEEKYHAREKYQQALEDENFRKMQISKRAFKRKYLKAKGAGSGSKEEAFQVLSEERADKLLEGIRNKEDWALKFASDTGIKAENVGKSEDHDKAVRASLLKSLMGGIEGEDDYHSSDVNEYNAFTKGAEAKKLADADTRTFKEKMKDKYASFKKSAGEFAGNAWESVKTGGRKIVSGIGRTASGAKNLLKRGLEGAKKLATSKEARSDAWRSFKTGVGNAADKVGTGAIKAGKAIGRGAVKAYNGAKDFITNADTRRAAWDSVKTGAAKAAKYVGSVAKHSVKSRMHKIRDWYNEGVDQMNTHKDTYDRMGFGDRFMWSLKNLPARMTHGTMKNRTATALRTVDNERAEAAVAQMLQKEEEEKNGASAAE